MNSKRTKEIRERVYRDSGYEATAEQPKKAILRYPQFRSMLRAAKRIYLFRKRYNLT